MAIETTTPDEYRKMMAEAMSEKDLQKEVRKKAKENEHQARMIFVELKSEKGKVSPDQEEAHRLLRLVGHAVYVWRPSDLLSGRVEEVLA